MKDEAALVAAARAGDDDAFTALYQAHSGYVRAVGRSILRSEELDDMCQETFLLAFTRLDGFHGTAGFRTWITRIAINQCLLVLRRRGQASHGDSMLVDFEAVEDDVLFKTCDASLENVPARLDVEKLLRGLPATDRRILQMAYLEEWPEQEIADLLGIRVSVLRGRLYRLRLRLRNR